MPNPLSALPAAEQALVGAINAVTSTLDTIATPATLDVALGRLEAAADGVRRRIRAAMASLSNTVADICEEMERLATDVVKELDTAHQETVTVSAADVGFTISRNGEPGAHVATLFASHELPDDGPNYSAAVDEEIVRQGEPYQAHPAVATAANPPVAGTVIPVIGTGRHHDEPKKRRRGKKTPVDVNGQS
jgi:hypothetical protein